MRLRRLERDEPRGPELGDAVREHRLDHLLLGQRLAADHARAGERGRLLDQARRRRRSSARRSSAARGGTSCASSCMPSPSVPSRWLSGTSDVVEAVGRVMIAEGVAEERRAHAPRCRAVSWSMKNSECGARVRAVREPRLQDEVVRVVRARDVPLLAARSRSRRARAARSSRSSTSEPEPLSVIA